MTTHQRYGRRRSDDAMRSATRGRRSALGFAACVGKHFAVLEEQGFLRVRNLPTLVRYESRSLFINIYHGRSSYEIGAELGRLGKVEDERQPYPMSALLGAAGSPAAKSYRDYATHTAEGVNDGVAKLADMFHRYVNRKLLQSTDLFRLLEKQREAWGEDFAREVSLTQARRKLEAAWRAKDYARVVEVLEPLRASLSVVELKKLAYSKKQRARN